MRMLWWGKPLHIFVSQVVAANDVVERELYLEKEGSSPGFSAS